MALALVVSATAPGVAQQAETGRYVPYSGIERGTDGVRRTVLEIANDSDVPLHCTAQLAHWYSDTLGSAAPGAVLSVELWHDPVAGSLSLLNAQADRMPIEAVTCGPQALPHAARVPLAFTAGPTVTPLTRRCARTGDDWTCR